MYNPGGTEEDGSTAVHLKSLFHLLLVLKIIDRLPIVFSSFDAMIVCSSFMKEIFDISGFTTDWKDSLVAWMRSINSISVNVIQCIFSFDKEDAGCFLIAKSQSVVCKAFVYQQHVHSLSEQSQIEKNRQIRQWACRFRQSSSIFSKDQYIVIDHWMDFERVIHFGLFLVAEAVPYVGLDHWKIAFDSWIRIKAANVFSIVSFKLSNSDWIF